MIGQAIPLGFEGGASIPEEFVDGKEVLSYGLPSGFYKITGHVSSGYQILYVDNTNDGGGWMLWANRSTNSDTGWDIRKGPSSHWSGWNSGATGLITSDWSDLTTEGYIHGWPFFDGTRQVKFNTKVSGNTATSPGSSTNVLIATENGTAISANNGGYVTWNSGSTSTTCPSPTGKKYIWSKNSAISGWNNAHTNSQYTPTQCNTDWPNLATNIGNYVAFGDCSTCYSPVAQIFGNGRTGYYQYGNAYDADGMDWTLQFRLLDHGSDGITPNTWYYNNQLWIK